MQLWYEYGKYCGLLAFVYRPFHANGIIMGL